jgi:DNA-binding protein HU-beta
MAITKDQLLTDIAESTDVSKATARAMLEQLSAIVSDALEHGEELTLPGIGKLKVSERPARTGRNPQTGVAMSIAAKKVVKFVPAKSLNDAING